MVLISLGVRVPELFWSIPYAIIVDSLVLIEPLQFGMANHEAAWSTAIR